MTQVVFDPIGFVARYPEFASVSSTVLGMMFTEATAFCDNTDGSQVQDIPTRTVLLNMLTAHITALNFGVSGQAANSLVGRVSEAKEGSVSVKADMGTTSEAAAWYNQTKYGAAYWRASSSFRGMIYIPAARQIPTFVPRA